MCNGRGTCGCNGRCECQDPYLGEYCEVCSGDESCLEQTCSAHTECARCAVDFFNQILPMTEMPELLTIDSLDSLEGLLPNGSSLMYDASSNTFFFGLPSGFCPEGCTQNVVVINGTDDVDYMIDSELYTHNVCVYIIIYIYIYIYNYVYICMYNYIIYTYNMLRNYTHSACWYTDIFQTAIPILSVHTSIIVHFSI